ncbi:MAG: nitric oxide reductase activation protein [Sterolibacteriaceae bacterium]|nr:nitric oxide reductase activation protein [Sterolibacteriaceae bacterium]
MSERKLFAHELEARLDELLLLTLRQRSAALPAAQLEALPRQRQERVLHWVGIAAQTSTELGWAIAQRAGARAAESGLALDDWARAGLEAHDAGGLAAAQARLDDFAAVAPDATRTARGVSFAAVEGRLAGFLHALDGRPMQLRCGPKTWTDGETLWLPETLDLAADAAGNRRLYTVIAALLWAQARFGTFNVDPEPELVQWADREVALDWFSLFEGMRLEARLALELPGLARDMAALRGPWPADLAPVAARLARPEASAADSLACMAELRRVGAGDTAHPPYRTALDPLAARRLRAARIARDAGTLRRALNIMRAIDPHSRGGASDSEYPPLAADGDSVPAELQAGDLQGLPPDARAAAQSLAQDLDGIPPEFLRPAGPGAWRPEESDAGDGAVAATSGEPDALYDEWDYRRGAWRRDWCHLYESEGPAGEHAWVDEVRLRHAHLIRGIRRRFEALRGEDKPQRRQLDGEEIDLDAQVDARADRLGGAEPSPRLFIHRRRVERSLAVMFMVDMSGSTKGWVNDAERESLVLLCEAIEALGDSYAIYGFSGWTRTHCDIYRIKRFGDRYDAATRQRIAGIEARDYTRMGVAVRHLSGLLQRQNARHKLLVTLSDGRPDDHGDEYRGRYGIEDTRRALLEAREKGIRSYCVTIDRHGADYLPQLYGPAHYTVIDDAKKLPARIADIYRKLTA